MGNLSARYVSTAKPGRHSDGEGLILQVSATGIKSWYLRYQLNGRRRDMALGRLGDMSLSAAREKAGELRKLVRQGFDPLEVRNIEVPTVPTFTQAAARYIRAHRHGWRNRKHARQWCATIRTYAVPTMGAKAVDTLTTEDILRVLSPLWLVKTETAKRLQGRLENVLDFATARTWRSGENPARWRGHLSKLLASPRKVATPEHHPAMPWVELPSFMAELRGNPSISSLALQWLILTSTRTSETLGAQWSEVDSEAGIWTIPASRMKARRMHRVPLSTGCREILERLPRLEGTPYVFPGARGGRPLSNMALLQLMRGMGHGVQGPKSPAVPHGFRSTFREWCAEQTPYPREVAEAALAHVNADKVEAAYLRSDLLARRARLMEDWAQFLSRPAATITALKNRPAAQTAI